MAASPQVALSRNGVAQPDSRTTAGYRVSLHPTERTSTLVGYARVSRHDQDPELQQAELRKAGCDRIYTDHGVSGMKASRPEFDACLDYLRAGDTFVVWKLDRVGRSLPNLVEFLQTLRAKDVRFRSLTEGIDTTGAMGELMYHVIGAFAQFERSLIVERTLGGLAAARARGRVGGRPEKCTPEMVDAARRLMAGPDGLTVTDAARQLGIHRATLHRHLIRSGQDAAGPAGG